MPMAESLRAIETIYKGYRFRSRLEARWAVFFDALGVVWDYEPEGFAIDGLGGYLPDFWIDTWEAYVEVKPTLDADISKPMFLAEHAPVLVVYGNPYWDEYTVVPLGWLDRSEDFQHAKFAQCRKCDELWLVCSDGESWKFPLGGDTECYAISTLERGAHLTNALERARRARFEFGESG